MPIPLIQSLASKGKKSPAEVEKMFGEIEKSIRKSSPSLKDDEVYSRVVGGIKNNLGIKEEFEEEKLDEAQLDKGMVRIMSGPYKNILGYITGEWGNSQEVKVFGQDFKKKQEIDKKMGTKTLAGQYLYIPKKELEYMRESLDILEKIRKVLNEDFNEGDEVMFKGKKYFVSHKLSNGMWELVSKDEKERIQILSSELKG